MSVDSMEAAAMRRNAVDVGHLKGIDEAVLAVARKMDLDENRQMMQVPFMWDGRVWIGQFWGCLVCMAEREGDEGYEGPASRMPPRKNPPVGRLLYRSPGEPDRFRCASCNRECERISRPMRLDVRYGDDGDVTRGKGVRAVLGYVPGGVEIDDDLLATAERWHFEDCARSLTSVDLLEPPPSEA